MNALPRRRTSLALEALGYLIVIFSLIVMGLSLGHRIRSPGPMPLAGLLGVMMVRRARSGDVRRPNDWIALIAGILFLAVMATVVLTSSPAFR